MSVSRTRLIAWQGRGPEGEDEDLASDRGMDGIGSLRRASVHSLPVSPRPFSKTIIARSRCKGPGGAERPEVSGALDDALDLAAPQPLGIAIGNQIQVPIASLTATSSQFASSRFCGGRSGQVTDRATIKVSVSSGSQRRSPRRATNPRLDRLL